MHDGGIEHVNRTNATGKREHRRRRHLISHPVTLEVDSPAGILPPRLLFDGGDGARTTLTITPEPALSG